jgi:hypothetical protein
MIPIQLNFRRYLFYQERQKIDFQNLTEAGFRYFRFGGFRKIIYS